MRFGFLLLAFALALPGRAQSTNLLANPGFEGTGTGWTPHVEGKGTSLSRETRIHHTGLASGRIQSESGDQALWPAFEQVFRPPFHPGTYLAQAFVRLDPDPSSMDSTVAYLAFEFYSPAGARTKVVPGTATHGTEGDWTRIRCRAKVPEGTAFFKLKLILHGAGTAWFDDASLTLAQDPAADLLTSNRNLDIEVSPTQALNRLVGFGAEVDPWLFNQENRAKGVGAADIDLISGRMKGMGMSLARVFIWWKTWNPSGDLKTFDWESDGMVSLYKTLAMLQAQGISVITCGAEWQQHPYDHPKEAAQAIAALMEHLLIAKKFTCIKYWTLSNEPYNQWYQNHYSFASYVGIHREVVAQFIRLGIRDRIRVLGADEGGNLTWFQNVARELHDIIDAYSIHVYLKKEEIGSFVEIIRDRQAALARLDPRASVKPLIITELGVTDENTTDHHNQYMRTPDCGLRMAWLVTTSLNLGIEGCSVWTLCKVYYPGFSFMDYGLWEFKDTSWRERPVFHTYSLFTRGCAPGTSVIKTTLQGAGESIRVAAVRNGTDVTVYLVNLGLSSANVRLHVPGASGKASRDLVPEEALEKGRPVPIVSSLVTKAGWLQDAMSPRAVAAYHMSLLQP